MLMNDEKKPEGSGEKCQILKDGTRICKPVKPEEGKKKEGLEVKGRVKRIVIEVDDKSESE